MAVSWRRTAGVVAQTEVQVSPSVAQSRAAEPWAAVTGWSALLLYDRRLAARGRAVVLLIALLLVPFFPLTFFDNS